MKSFAKPAAIPSSFACSPRHCAARSRRRDGAAAGRGHGRSWRSASVASTKAALGACSRWWRWPAALARDLAAARAAGLALALDAAIGVLRNQRLVRDSAGGRAQLETLTIGFGRASSTASRPTSRRSIHLSLAGPLELEPDVDPFLLVEHYHGGGDDARAARAAVEAARRAYAALAFEQAGAPLRALASRWPRRGRAVAFGIRGRRRRRLLAQAGRGGDAGAGV